MQANPSNPLFANPIFLLICGKVIDPDSPSTADTPTIAPRILSGTHCYAEKYTEIQKPLFEFGRRLLSFVGDQGDHLRKDKCIQSNKK